MKKLNRKNKQRRHNQKTNWKEDPIPDYSHWNSFWGCQTEQAAQSYFINGCSQGTSVQSHAATERLSALFQLSQFMQKKIQF